MNTTLNEQKNARLLVYNLKYSRLFLVNSYRNSIGLKNFGFFHMELFMILFFKKQKINSCHFSMIFFYKLYPVHL